jgi:type I restriction enzyme S subunit
MTTRLTPVALEKVLAPISRREKLSPEKSYRLLGAHWYARGLYIKDVKLGAQIAAKELYAVEEGDFVYNRLFAWKGAFAVASAEDHGCYVSNEFPCFRIDIRKAEPNYLWYYFSRSSAWDEAFGLSTGGTPTSRNRLKESKLLAMRIFMPPISEQRRIVARIENLASKIPVVKHSRQIAMEQCQRLLVSKLSEVRRELLGRYESKKLGQLTVVTSGGTPSREVLGFWNGTIPWIKTGELVDGDISNAEERITATALQESSAKLFPIETVLIALYGQGQTRGRTGRLLIPAATNQACCAVLPCPSLQSQFIQYWLRSYYYELRENVRGGAQPNWNSGMIKDLPIVTPPVDVQQSIVRRLSYIEEKIRQDIMIHALLPAILDKAFKGKL